MTEEYETLRKNPAKLKLEILTQGIRLAEEIKLEDYEAPERYFYGYSKNSGTQLPSEMILPGNIVSNFFISPRSKISLLSRSLYLGNHYLSEIKFTPETEFSKFRLNDGVLCSRVATMYGLDVFSIFLNKRCSYFQTGQQCRFCSLDFAQRTKGRENVRNPSISQVIETLRIALSLDSNLFHHVLISSGAYDNPDAGIVEQLHYINEMRKIDRGRVNYHLVTLPPRSRELLSALADSGPDTFSFDIEVFDKELFRKYCPGKEKQIGYDEWLAIFDYCSSRFPKSKLKIGFVCGLEPIETLVEGMEFVGKRGLTPALNIFHPDKGTHLQHHCRPSKEYVLDAIKEQARIYKTYGLIPVFPNFGRRSSLDSEVYRRYFDEPNS